MSSRAAEVGPRSTLPTLLLTLVLGVAGCSSGPGPRDADRDDGDDRAVAAADPAALEDAVVDVLDARARAVRRGDVDALVGDTVGAGATRTAQTTYAQNLAALPLAGFRYRLEPGSLRADGEERVVVRARLEMRLDPYDDVAVASDREITLRVAGPEPRVVSDVPVGDDPATGGAQPWDGGPLTVREQQGVLALFDADSAAYAEATTAATGVAADDVAARVPYEWTGDVVLYAPSDTELLAGLTDLPGGDADNLDGVAFGVAPAGGGQVRDERVILHPRMLTAEVSERDRLLRHELTHLALGGRDDDIPLWLAEGVAEWVSVSPVPPDERLISAAALAAARRGVDALPADDTFNAGPRSGANYGLAWQACEEIAATYGDDAVWTLVEAMGRRGDRSPALVLRRVLGLDPSDLAGQAADRILAAYGGR